MGMRRRFWIVAGALVALAIYDPYSPGAQQRRNMRLANQHIAVLKPLLASDPRYARVELHEFTGEGGPLLVIGRVESQADADAVKALVTRSHAPCPVVFHVLVLPEFEPATRP